MPKKPVYVLPGFLATGIEIKASRTRLIWSVGNLCTLGLGPLRLAPDGISPGPPDGVLCDIVQRPISPWDSILLALLSQLDLDQWQPIFVPYDFRELNDGPADDLAERIRTDASTDNPATIVAHSNGGLVALQTWGKLVATSDEGKVRRIVTMGTPFQGSYFTSLSLKGTSSTAKQFLALRFAAGAGIAFQGVEWTTRFIDGILNSWPGFYELMPALGGVEALNDPNRVLLYDASNYRLDQRPQQRWLDYVRLTVQPFFNSPASFPPSWVMTSVGGNGLQTPFRMNTDKKPLDLSALIYNYTGDAIVPLGSALREDSKQVICGGDHFSIPLDLAQDGTLVELILDERNPHDPPPAVLNLKNALRISVTAVPQSDLVSPLQCLSGG